MASAGKETRVYTIDDIAKELGVSKTTVSRAISGKGRLSAETRAKVLAFIEECNYRPNAVAKSLAKSRTYNLGLVLPGNYAATEPAFFQECMRGICEVASKNDYDVLISMVDGQFIAQLERIINNHKVDGVIVSRNTMRSPVVALLKEKKIPFVVVGASQEPDCLYVDNDNQEACRDLTALLLMKGIRRIALLGGEETHYVTHHRLKGYQAAHVQAGVTLNKELVFLNVNSSEEATRAVDKALQRGAECIVCMDDFICNLVLIRLRELGLQIPRDIRLASFYDSNILAQSNPSITSLKFNAKELGQVVCSLLLDQLEGKEVSNHVLLGYQVVLRESTK